MRLMVRCSWARRKTKFFWTPLDLQAHSRLASLLLEVRCGQAAVATLESLLQALPESSRTDEQRTAWKSAQQRLQEARTAARRGQKMHHYKLLGLERGCTAEEVGLHVAGQGGRDSCEAMCGAAPRLPPGVAVRVHMEVDAKPLQAHGHARSLHCKSGSQASCGVMSRAAQLCTMNAS